MQIVHTVGNDSLLCDLIETETPPRLVYSDLRHVFRDTAQCEYFIVRQKIYDMLFQAKSFLPEGVYFKAFELYRPMKKQILRWEKFYQSFKSVILTRILHNWKKKQTFSSQTLINRAADIKQARQ